MAAQPPDPDAMAKALNTVVDHIRRAGNLPEFDAGARILQRMDEMETRLTARVDGLTARVDGLTTRVDEMEDAPLLVLMVLLLVLIR
jgi:hypothetical protein